MSAVLAGAERACQPAPLAVLCGAGAFPLEVSSKAAEAGRTPFLIGIVGTTDAAIEAYPHVWLRMGEVGKLFGALKEQSIREIVMVGAMTRPEFTDLRLDWGAVKRAADLARLFRKGDNGLLVGLAAIFEGEGVCVVGAHEVAPQLLAPIGPLGSRAPSADDEADISLAAELLAALSRFDMGQGAVVAAGRVLAVEAAEGTDAMLARIGEMRATGRLRLKGPAGVLIKAPKAGQDLRLDMPAIGPQTVAGAAKAQLRGIAVAAGRVLIAERARCARAADAAGLFLSGFEA
ncbi:MAG TPA: UDP-2,3-diacylglucosamine diphosphatase LpxI [Roseiarcus sp.]|nr:UDP-2,3-diacylglucosamine diphosphatase LpxI [Roseiarcus sp.]